MNDSPAQGFLSEGINKGSGRYSHDSELHLHLIYLKESYEINSGDSEKHGEHPKWGHLAHKMNAETLVLIFVMGKNRKIKYF